MANLDRNFIATPSFVVKSDGGGNTITLQAAPVVSSTNTIGWQKINFGFAGVVSALNGELSPYNVTPSVSNGSDFSWLNPTDPDVPDNDRQARVYNFLNFVHDNPVHVKAINLRASADAVMPTQIIIKTPNIYTGQMDRQVIDVASKKTAYQYQNSIITIRDVDFYICRSSIIEFTGAFSSATATTTLFVDLVIDLYLSLEKGLVENYMLLNTASGQVVAAVEQTENEEAAAFPSYVTNAAATRATETITVNNGSAASWYQNKMRR